MATGCVEVLSTVAGVLRLAGSLEGHLGGGFIV
eukprot:CAMPEP_0170500844 /NCGR_PEP_ID=MMETSP0208-20121228/36292_1 /TAXON_ID=197538 /ORGANISM="Strombidium inclinatum, Strain S3" /LENGTH=32 /DNA_ID= /DNA_START= /DNA_END= /DNA_ORIENTATION=